MPFVSVIIPVFNGENFIKETVASVLSQSYLDFELIVVNDGSDDGSLAILKSFSDSRLQIIDIENGGVSNARNVGFDASKGDYLAFLDADDVWLEERLLSTVKFLDSHQEVGLVHTHMAIIDENGSKTGQILEGKEGYIIDDLLSWNGCCIPAPSSILVRREVLKNVGLFDVKISTAADQELFFRIAHKHKIGMVGEAVGLYRIHGQNMHLNIERMESEHIYTYNKADKLGLFKSNSFKKICYSNLYFILAGSYWVHTSHKSRALLMIVKSLKADFRNGMRKLLNKIV